MAILGKLQAFVVNFGQKLGVLGRFDACILSYLEKICLISPFFGQFARFFTLGYLEPYIFGHKLKPTVNIKAVQLEAMLLRTQKNRFWLLNNKTAQIKTAR